MLTELLLTSILGSTGFNLLKPHSYPIVLRDKLSHVLEEVADEQASILFQGNYSLSSDTLIVNRSLLVLSLDKIHNIGKSSLELSTVLFMFVEAVETSYLEKLFKENQRTKKLFLFTEGNTSSEEAKGLFNACWEHGILLISIVAVNAESARLYLFNKREFSVVCKYKFELIQYEFWKEQNERAAILENHVDLGLSQYCNMRVSWIETSPYVVNMSSHKKSGIHINVLDTMQEVFGGIIEYDLSDEINQEFVTNGTVHSMMKQMVSRQTDVGIGRLMMNDTKSVPCLFGPIFYDDIFVFVVPKPKRLKSYEKLLGVFNFQIWRFILYMVLIFICLFFIMTRIWKVRGHNFGGIIFDAFGMAIGSGTTRLPKRSSLRVLLMFYLFFCLNLDAIYLGKLSSVFSVPNYDEKINSILKMGRRGYGVNITWASERLIMMLFVTRYDPITQKFIRLRYTSEDNILKEVAHYGGNATATLRSVLDTNPPEHALVDYFLMENLYLTMHETFYVRKSWLLQETVIRWSYELFEKGFNVKWWKDIVRNRTIFWPKLEEEDKAIVLTMSHYWELYKIYFFGCCAAVIMFVLEFPAKWLEENTNIVAHIKFIIGLLKPPI